MSYAHMALAVATIVGWEHLDALWPASVWPEGIRLGAERPMVGLLTVADAGRPAKLTVSEALVQDWKTWLQENYRVDTSQCVGIAEAVRQKLLSGHQSRPGSAGAVHYWVVAFGTRRLGPPRCAERGGLHIATVLRRVRSATPIQCSRDVFVAHGFACPGDRKSSSRVSETYLDPADYYPPAALRKGVEGSARVEVIRDDSGSPTSCRLLKSSGSDELDTQTCKLVGTDPGFTYRPKNLDAESLSRTITQTVTWKLPEVDPASSVESVR